jgi:pSer/pThr/pTyr-binding forkhead associated (FHA) protein
MNAQLIGRTGKARGVDTMVSDRLVIGSAPGAGLRIESRTVSRRHVQVVRSGTEFVVEDLGSRNGTFLNGQRVRRFPIRHLDVLSVGPDVDLIFMEVRGAAPLVARPTALRAAIRWISGPLAGRVQEIPAEGGLVLGRTGDLDALGAISRRHAVLTIRGEYVTVEDLGSANGTWVNTNEIATVTRLADGDEIRLANVVRLKLAVPYRDDAIPSECASAEIPLTVFVASRSSGDDAVLDVPSLLDARPAAGAPERPAVGGLQAEAENVPAAVPPAPVIDGPVVQVPRGSLTSVAPHGVAAFPRGDAPAVGQPSIQLPLQPSATIVAPREAANPPLSGQAGMAAASGPGTVIPPRQPAASVPDAVAALAEAARAGRDSAESGPRLEIGARPDLDRRTIEERLADDARPGGDAPGADAAHGRQAPVPAADEPPIEPTVEIHRTPPCEPSQAAGIIGIRLTGRDLITLDLGSFIVGRGPNSDLRLEGRDVGRRHARLDVLADGVTIEDFDTANGTFVNDEPVTVPREVPDGARLRFATIEWVVTYVRSGEPAR